MQNFLRIEISNRRTFTFLFIRIFKNTNFKSVILFDGWLSNICIYIFGIPSKCRIGGRENILGAQFNKNIDDVLFQRVAISQTVIISTISCATANKNHLNHFSIVGNYESIPDFT